MVKCGMRTTMRTPAPPSKPGTLRRPSAASTAAGFALSGAETRERAPVNVRDYEALAAERLDANAPAYFAGGAGDEWTLRENELAFERRQLRPRMLVDVTQVATATTVLGHEVSMPS